MSCSYLDCKIEFPLPNESARAHILEIHSRKMTTSPDVNLEELAWSTDGFNGPQLKAVCVEASMIAIREGATKLGHKHSLPVAACRPTKGLYRLHTRQSLTLLYTLC